MRPDIISVSSLILASGSPRRADLLGQLGLTFQVLIPAIDESIAAGESALAYVQRMSAEKFANVIRHHKGIKKQVILCADTVVVVEGEVLGKPKDMADGCNMLLRLSDREHQVFTSVSVGNKAGALLSFFVETRVKFRKLGIEESESYWQSGEPLDKAGGYGIQGLGAIFVESIVGSYSNVVGLPLMETSTVLDTFGISVLKLR